MASQKNVKFTSPDNSHVLTVRMTEGKSGFSVRAVLRENKDDAKPESGCPSLHENKDTADAAFKALVSEAINAGFVRAKNQSTKAPAFTTIPNVKDLGKKPSAPATTNAPRLNKKAAAA